MSKTISKNLKSEERMPSSYRVGDMHGNAAINQKERSLREKSPHRADVLRYSIPARVHARSDRAPLHRGVLALYTWSLGVRWPRRQAVSEI